MFFFKNNFDFLIHILQRTNAYLITFTVVASSSQSEVFCVSFGDTSDFSGCRGTYLDGAKRNLHG